MKFDMNDLNIQENVKQLSDKVLIEQTDVLVEHERGLQEFKNLYAHELQDNGNISILTYLLTKAVQHKKKTLGIAPKKVNAPLPLSPRVPKETKAKSTPRRKALPIATKRFLWKRANGCCEHHDGISKLRCNSKFALQPDHIIPIALGGSDEISNLQLLCRVHNSRRAIKTFGIRRAK